MKPPSLFVLSCFCVELQRTWWWSQSENFNGQEKCVPVYVTVTYLAVGPELCLGRRWCLAGILVHRVYLHLALDEMGTQFTLLPTTQEDILGSSYIPWEPSLAQVQCTCLWHLRSSDNLRNFMGSMGISISRSMKQEQRVGNTSSLNHSHPLCLSWGKILTSISEAFKQL